MGKLRINIDRIESAGELEKIKHNSPIMKLDEACNTYCYISIANDFEIGVEYYNHGIDIEYKCTSNNKYIFWGIGIHLLCINIYKKEVVFCKELGSVFLELLSDLNNDYCVVICELDLYVYKNNNLLWKKGFKDIASDYELVNNKYIRIVSCDGKETIYSMNDGSIIK